jgi:hypothetical protein
MNMEEKNATSKSDLRLWSFFIAYILALNDEAA